MKNELTAKRMQLALSNANMKPQELADKSGIGKASISQYVNGSHAPGNVSAEKIGKILNVNSLWLMGFDVPMERTASTKEESPKIMQYYELLNDIGKHEATKRVEELTHLQKYKKEGEKENCTVEFSKELTPIKDYLIPNAAHDRMDIEVTEDMKKHDDAFFDED